MTLSKEQWKNKYIQFMIDRGVSKKVAEDSYEAGVNDESPEWGHQYDDCPEESAADEMSYWDG